jgi:hypothetical protein
VQGGDSGLGAGARYPADDAAIAVDSYSPGCPVLGFGLVGWAAAVDTGVYFDQFPRVGVTTKELVLKADGVEDVPGIEVTGWLVPGQQPVLGQVDLRECPGLGLLD